MKWGGGRGWSSACESGERLRPSSRQGGDQPQRFCLATAALFNLQPGCNQAGGRSDCWLHMFLSLSFVFFVFLSPSSSVQFTFSRPPRPKTACGACLKVSQHIVGLQWVWAWACGGQDGLRGRSGEPEIARPTLFYPSQKSKCGRVGNSMPFRLMCPFFFFGVSVCFRCVLVCSAHMLRGSALHVHVHGDGHLPVHPEEAALKRLAS